jgi:hypothetical protein
MAAEDSFGGRSEGMADSVNNAESITPHATNELTNVTRGISVNVSGNVGLIPAGDSAAVTVYLAAGMIHPIRVKAVRVANTTATGIIGWF